MFVNPARAKEHQHGAGGTVCGARQAISCNFQYIFFCPCHCGNFPPFPCLSFCLLIAAPQSWSPGNLGLPKNFPQADPAHAQRGFDPQAAVLGKGQQRSTQSGQLFRATDNQRYFPQITGNFGLFQIIDG